MRPQNSNDKPPPIFVFGSNEAGRHGKGAALFARQNHGAVYGKGIGLQGNSYGIPTKDSRLSSLSLSRIETYVSDFKTFAAEHPHLHFNVTAIGCGLAGYKPEQIAPMFRDAPPNCELPVEFTRMLEARHELAR
jgi:hypothetical protein